MPKPYRGGLSKQQRRAMNRPQYKKVLERAEAWLSYSDRRMRELDARRADLLRRLRKDAGDGPAFVVAVLDDEA